jgi:transposase
MNERRKELEQLSRDELIEGYLLLERRVETLEKRLDELHQLLGLKKIEKTSENSSIPPSQSHKANQKKKRQAKRGPKKGHVGKSRQRQVPDKIVEYRVLLCDNCGADLSDLPQHEAGRHQVIDIPPIRPEVSEVVRMGRYCPCCQCYQRAPVPEGYEAGRVVGRHLEGLVLYLHYAHPLSYQRVQHILEEMCGLKLSIGALVNIVKRGQSVLQHGADAIRERIQQAPVVGSDETGARVDGQNFCQWVFQTPEYAYFVIRPSKAASELHDVMGDAQPEVWVSDAGSSQLKHPAAQHQLCLAHVIRKLQFAIDTHRCVWSYGMQILLYQAIRLTKHRHTLSPRQYAIQVYIIQRRLDELLRLQPQFEESYKLWKHLYKHRDALLLFLERDDVPPTNNASEQALRNSVIYRKVTGGLRTDWGAKLYANLISILESARRQERSIFDILTSVFSPTPTFSWIDE